MFKHQVTYTNFDNVKQTETLYFNLTRTEIMNDLDLDSLMLRIAKLQTIFNGEVRTLEPNEVREIMDLVLDLAKWSYGERSADGRHFRKTPGAWEDFKSSAAYDEFIMSLFTDPTNAVTFMVGILPPDLVAKVKAENPEMGEVLDSTPSHRAETPVETVPLPDAKTMSHERYTSLQGILSEEELARAVEGYTILPPVV